MRISEQFIHSLLARVDLIELIAKKIQLRQVGSNFVGLCPFHQEKTPSFTVNKSKQFFHCFGCQEHGDAIRFIMLTENKNFLTTVQDLADRYGLSIEKDKTLTEDPLTIEIYKILNLAIDYYHQNLLKNTAQATNALNYLINRNIKLTTIRQFKLGFAESSWRGLIDFFNTMHKKNQLHSTLSPLVVLQQAGLILEKNHKYYDRFRNRIMFPILNKCRNPIGFGARALSSEQMPKYLNSPETIVFNKSKELYGLAEVKSTLKNFKNLIVVEGYLDCLTLFQAKICNVVATLGTALNEEQIQNILNITSEIIFCFDGDVAGFNASVKAMEIVFKLLNAKILQPKHVIKFALLPEKYDPDLLVREKGVAEFNRIVLEAKHLSDFFFDCLLKKIPDKSIENLNLLAIEAKQYIAKIPDLIMQNLWYEKLAQILGVDSNILKNTDRSRTTFTLREKHKQYHLKKNSNQLIARNIVPPVSNVIKAIAMLIINPRLICLCNELIAPELTNILNFPLPSELELLFKVIAAINNYLAENLNNLTNDENIFSRIIASLEPVYAQKLLLIEPQKIVQLIPINGIEQEFIGSVKQIKKILLELSIDRLLITSKERELNSVEKLQLQQMLKEI